MAFTITNSGKDTLISDGTQNPSFNRNFIAGLTKATAVENPQTGDLDTVQVVDTTKQAILMAYDDITDIGGSTPAALGLLDATQVASYLNNNYFSLAGGGGGSLPAGTADKNNLQWNNTLGQWVDNPKVKFGYQNSDLSGYITGKYGSFNYGETYAWRVQDYSSLVAGNNNVDNFIYKDAFTNPRFRLNSESLINASPEFIGVYTLPSGVTNNNEGYGESIDFDEVISTMASPLSYNKETITPLQRETEVNYNGFFTRETVTYEDLTFTAGASTFYFGYDSGTAKYLLDINNGGDWSLSMSDDTINIYTQINNAGLLINSTVISLQGAGALEIGATSITGAGAYLQANGAYAFIQGIPNDTNTVTGGSSASMLLASQGTIDIDPDTLFQTIGSVGLGGFGYNMQTPNTAYASGMSTRSVTTDAGGAGYYLDMANDPINLLVMDVTVQADSFYIPAASVKYLDVEIIVKKIGANNLTIDDGGNGTVEQIGGGWGNTYVVAGTNSAVTIKCVLLGINYYWIVY
jgi:hypothetical protein